MKEFKFVWLDDRQDRIEQYGSELIGELRGENVKAVYEFIKVESDILDRLSNRVNEWKTTNTHPDMIVLDHDFTLVSNRKFDLHGAALAHLIRIGLPNVPIVCVSAQSIKSAEFSAEDIPEYLFLFESGRIHVDLNKELLFAIANDFSKLSITKADKPRQEIVKIIGTPEVDQETLYRILPEKFGEKNVHGISQHQLARWIINVLMDLPGFLYDALEVATFLGLQEESFLKKVKPLFESARYKGLFYTESRPLWWGAKLTDVLYQELAADVSLPSWLAGRKIQGIDDNDYSVCEVSGKKDPPPDVVAYTDSTKEKRVAVSYECTEPLSVGISTVPGFQTPLKIRKEV